MEWEVVVNLDISASPYIAKYGYGKFNKRPLSVVVITYRLHR